MGCTRSRHVYVVGCVFGVGRDYDWESLRQINLLRFLRQVMIWDIIVIFPTISVLLYLCTWIPNLSPTLFKIGRVALIRK
jgi:hypothetical protein